MYLTSISGLGKSEWGEDKLAGKGNSFKKVFAPLSLWVGSEQQEFALVEQILPFQSRLLFWRVSLYKKANKKLKKLSPFEKNVENLPSVSIPQMFTFQKFELNGWLSRFWSDSFRWCDIGSAMFFFFFFKRTHLTDLFLQMGLFVWLPVAYLYTESLLKKIYYKSTESSCPGIKFFLCRVDPFWYGRLEYFWQSRSYFP